MELLFTRNHLPLSRLIRYVTGEPVSHCAVYQDGMVTQMTLFGLQTESMDSFLQVQEIVYRIEYPTVTLQFPEKAAPDLYRLLIACLKQLPHFKEPTTLIILFYLKLLSHEGVISWDQHDLFPLSCTHATWSELKNLAHAKSFRAHYDRKGLGTIALELEKILKVLL